DYILHRHVHVTDDIFSFSPRSKTEKFNYLWFDNEVAGVCCGLLRSGRTNLLFEQVFYSKKVLPPHYNVSAQIGAVYTVYGEVVIERYCRIIHTNPIQLQLQLIVIYLPQN
ncbi:MAG: hypothetical protein LBI82_12285, partial [Dysgonamonadaceae bacterium]|nr:hypothetical protein [Dysgonamonadaceae bacterium]